MNTTAANNSWTRFRCSPRSFGRCCVIMPVLAVLLTTASVAANSYVEDFTTTTYKDSLNTTADWNTIDGELKLFPFAPSLTGSYDTPGVAIGVAVAGDLAFVADYGSGLLVIDITDPTSPIPTGSYPTPGYARDVAVAGDHAFVAGDYFGLQVIDISDPTHPVFAGGYDTPGQSWSVAVAGDHAFVADRQGGLQVIDISDPLRPVLAGSYDTTGYPYGVAVAGDLAFVAANDYGLQVIDISDPTNPVLAGSYDTQGFAQGVAVAGDLAFVADYESGLQVIDISDPTNPVLAGSHDTPDLAYDVAVSGDLAFVADADSGLQVIDISDPSSPVLAGGYDTEGSAWSVMVSGNLAFVADHLGGLQVVKVSNSVDPRFAGSYITPGEAQVVSVAGDLAFVADGNSGLSVIDISDPTSPVLIGSYDTPGLASGVAVAGDLAFVADGAGGLQVIDIIDPSNPVLAGSVSTGGVALGVAIAGDLALVADYLTGLWLFDIRDPTSPALESVNNWGEGAVRDVAVSGDLAYVANGTGGLMVLDISDPSYPLFPGGYNTPGFALGVAVAGDLAFVADREGGLQVIDITDPADLVLAGSYNTPGLCWEVSVAGDLAFVADGSAGLQVIDITDPTNPGLTGSYETPGASNDVVVAGDLAYIAMESSGLLVIQAFQHDFMSDTAMGQSLSIDHASDTIPRVRFTSVQTAGVGLGLSANAGMNWQTMTLAGSWTRLNVPGDDLLWQTTHTWTPGVNPTVSDLTIEWLNEFSSITSIADVPDDQGGRVLIRLARSGFDFTDETEHVITDYNVWLRIDDAHIREAILSEGVNLDESLLGDQATLLDWDARRYFVTPPAGDRNGMPPGIWASVGGFPAIQQGEYGFIAETLADSTEAGTAWSVYCVTAHTANPVEWYASYPDSGYSVDNLAPAVPGNLVFGSPNILVWDEAPEPDFAYHSVYGSADPVFDPSATLIGYTVEPTLDVSVAPFDYYHVTTSDHAGNESEAASIQNTSTGIASGEAAPPRVFALRAARPSPFRTRTSIGFVLPQAEEVRLAIYDMAGRQVRVLADDARGAGEHSASWDGNDQAGRRVAQGIYFARIEAGDFVASRRLVVIR